VPGGLLPAPINLSYRNWTLVGLPDRAPIAQVDPGGWVTPVPGGPSIAVWVGDARRMWTLGPLPGWGVDEDLRLRQHRVEAGPFVRTVSERQELRVTVDVFPALVQGDVVFGITARVVQRAPAARPVRLAFSIRPANPEGHAPIRALSRRDDGWWEIDGAARVFVPRPGHELRLAAGPVRDVYSMVGGRLREGAVRRSSDARTSVTCARGLATGAEVYRVNLGPGESMKRTIWCGSHPAVGPVLRRASASRLFTGALSDWKGTLRTGARIEPPAHARLLESSRSSLLAAVGSDVIPAEDLPVVIAALGRLGHLRRAARLVAGGDLHDGGLILATVDHIGLGGDLALLRERWPAIRRAVRALEKAGPTLSAAAALRAATVAARWLGEPNEERRLALLAGRVLEELRSDLEGRSDVDVLAAVWPSGLVAATEAPVDASVRRLERRSHRAGVFDDLAGGVHVARTCWLGQIALAAGRSGAAGRLDYLAEHASDTGAWPAAFHPERGGVAGSGDCLGAAAEIVLLCRNLLVQEEGNTLHLFRGGDRRWFDGETTCEGLPTRFGTIDLRARQGCVKLDCRWRRRPRIVWHKAPDVEGRLVVGDLEVEGLGPELSTG